MRLWLLLSLAAAAAATTKEDPCSQPRKIGPCEALVPRWYYSAKAGQCLKFNWGGCQPNGNNFKTFAACNKRCNPCRQPRKVGPCKARKPRYFFSAKFNKCVKFYWGGCKPNGNNFISLKACKKQCCSRGCGNPCKQPLKVGPCRAAIPRYYYSTKAGKCLKFSWGGCQPNGNNFKTLAACNKRCDPCLQPRKVGPCYARKPRYYFSAKLKKCVKFYWGGCQANGNNFISLKACKKQCCPRGCGNPCKQPKKVGPCYSKKAIPRYYYSTKTGKCLKFSWGGCQPNGNNFKTFAACNKRCNPCIQPRKVGPCRARKPRYYFSAKLNKCVKFYWGGCKPNGNNFISLKACKKQCCLRGCGNPCKQPKKVGPCRAAIPRYYYSAKAGKCLKFYWGGCKPNGNNFISLKACKKQCCSRGCGNPCKQPKKVGPCRAAIPRYFYSAKAGKCLKFSWGGCQPNGNNFRTFGACSKQCCRGRYCGYKKPRF